MEPARLGIFCAKSGFLGVFWTWNSSLSDLSGFTEKMSPGSSGSGNHCEGSTPSRPFGVWIITPHGGLLCSTFGTSEICFFESRASYPNIGRKGIIGTPLYWPLPAAFVRFQKWSRRFHTIHVDIRKMSA